MAVNDTPESVIAAAQVTGAPRQYMGTGAIPVVNASAETANQKLAPVRDTDAYGDPYSQPMGRKMRIPAGRMGASYRIRAMMPAQMCPTVCPTMNDARILPPKMVRSTDNFWSGTASQG